MEIREDKKGTVHVISIKGRLDTTTYGMLEKRLSDLYETGEKQILVNCHHMDYVSSSGLRVLLIGLKRAKIDEGRFAICCLRENIREIFEISGFSSIFDIYATEEEALNTF